jgi:hypothetical protein
MNASRHIRPLAGALTATLLVATGCATAPDTRRAAADTGFQRLDTELVYSARYFPEHKTLSILFQAEGGRDYADVPETVYREWLDAKSKDEYFRKNISKKFKETPWPQ